MPFENCTQLRRKHVRRGKMNEAGEFTATVQGWITEACGVPLFSDAARATGICSACASGWCVLGNMPANIEIEAANTEAAAPEIEAAGRKGDMTTGQSLYDAALVADERFKSELARVYGKNAGEARSLPWHCDPQVMGAMVAKRAADKAWHSHIHGPATEAATPINEQERSGLCD